KGSSILPPPASDYGLTHASTVNVVPKFKLPLVFGMLTTSSFPSNCSAPPAAIARPGRAAVSAAASKNPATRTDGQRRPIASLPHPLDNECPASSRAARVPRTATQPKKSLAGTRGVLAQSSLNVESSGGSGKLWRPRRHAKRTQRRELVHHCFC